MTLLGLDFDNTLVRYDRLFHQLALEKELIEESIPVDKTAIRNHLRSRGQDQLFTLLQGEVYGNRILSAEPAEGMLKTLKELHERGVKMVLISHKTRTPYKGPAYDLHQAALQWLEKYNFFSSTGLNWTEKQIFFEETFESKINRIKSLKCSHFIDDLPEVINKLPDYTKGIHYCPGNRLQSHHIHLENWETLKELI